MPLITPALRRAQASSSAPGLAASTASTATLAAQSLPPLPAIAHDAATLARVAPPIKQIHSEEDVHIWQQSEAYAVYTLFVQRICEACVGKPTRLPPPPAATAAKEGAVERLVRLLYELNSWTDSIEPHAKPQRFGNLAFRDWGARLTQRIEQLHHELLPAHLVAFAPELGAYLLDAFGSFTRIDYGSGHELAFFVWLSMLYRLGLFTDSTWGEVADPRVEEVLGLEVFPLYLLVVWRLQDRYGLEPAGSHGVWGLDDFHFLPYVIGAAQLRSQSALRPSHVNAVSAHASILQDQLGSARDPATLISRALELPSSLLSGNEGVVVPNLYLSSLLRIQVLKRGPFHEHSPLLHDIASSVPNWIKLHAGMLKMYAAECLSKKVVVQHLPFGKVGLVWPDNPAPVAGQATVPPARGMALGGRQGNLGSLGVPTARQGASVPPARATGSLGQTLGMPRTVSPTRLPSSTAMRTPSAHTSLPRPPQDKPPSS